MTYKERIDAIKADEDLLMQAIFMYIIVNNHLKVTPEKNANPTMQHLAFLATDYKVRYKSGELA